MSKPTQKQWVIDQLNKNGKISRNYCLKNYITRLSALIFNLQEEGWQFKTEWQGGNFVYIITKRPPLKLF